MRSSLIIAAAYKGVELHEPNCNLFFREACFLVRLIGPFFTSQRCGSTIAPCLRVDTDVHLRFDSLDFIRKPSMQVISLWDL